MFRRPPKKRKLSNVFLIGLLHFYVKYVFNKGFAQTTVFPIISIEEILVIQHVTYSQRQITLTYKFYFLFVTVPFAGVKGSQE